MKGTRLLSGPSAPLAFTLYLTCAALACAALAAHSHGQLAAPTATQTPPPPAPPHFPPTQVVIEGNDTPNLGALAKLTARVSPITATVPFTYHWQASGQPDATYYPYALSFADYYAAWDTLGPQTITVTVSNIAGSAVATRTLSVLAAPQPPVAPTSGGWIWSVYPYRVGEPNYLSWQVRPLTITLPITYSWQVTDFAPMIHAGRASTSDGLQVAWPSPGRKRITVTASNIAGAISGTREITVWAPVYLPIVNR